MKDKLLVFPKEENKLLNITESYSFSLSDKTADLYLKPSLINSEGSLYELYTDKYSLYGLKTTLVGEHILHSIAAAVSVLNIFSLGGVIISELLKAVDKAETRGKFIMAKGLIFLDDTYSASAKACACHS